MKQTALKKLVLPEYTKWKEINKTGRKKKFRLHWSRELHQRFLYALSELGNDAVPTQIKKIMNVEGLTRDHISSHLQKYRLTTGKIEELEEDGEKISRVIQITNLISEPSNEPINSEAENKNIVKGFLKNTYSIKYLLQEEESNLNLDQRNLFQPPNANFLAGYHSNNDNGDEYSLNIYATGINRHHFEPVKKNNNCDPFKEERISIDNNNNNNDDVIVFKEVLPPIRDFLKEFF
eukprot:TRINITY_DN307_c0_g1_i1.p1 TRINITY_DN307_c0_g1~~TRINITY_DN307_c0_g1_i1.p1  ORF type:complete len:235 (-),score=55.07 TRINITY_DN307_c0_g1_i1:206-910(-)